MRQRKGEASRIACEVAASKENCRASMRELCPCCGMCMLQRSVPCSRGVEHGVSKSVRKATTFRDCCPTARSSGKVSSTEESWWHCQGHPQAQMDAGSVICQLNRGPYTA